jgi:hypothetical protein
MSGGPSPLPLIAPPAWLGMPLGQPRGPHAPAPLPEPGAGSRAASLDEKMLQDIKDLLKKSATGAAAVKFMEDKSLKTEFVSGGSSFWDGKKIVLDRTVSTEQLALDVVHEVNHTKSTLAGTTPDIMKLTRDDYLKGMLDEEARGTVDSIKTKNELVAAGVSITANFAREAEYNAAYKKATEDLTKADPKATPAELKAAGEKAGADAVLKGFKDGSVLTGTRPQIPYPDYYGKEWDKRHPPTPTK